MTDPWKEFLVESRDHPIAGYFERGSAPGLPGRWACSYTDPDEHWTLEAKDSASELDETTARFLREDPSRAIVGYVGFDAIGLFEPLLRTTPPGSPFPRGELVAVRRLRLRPVPTGGRTPPPLQRRSATTPRADSLPRAAFERRVERLRTAIGQGDAFQVVLSHRREWARPADVLARATLLRARERFAYFYYLRFGDREVVGASPESVLEVHRGRGFLSPIAATRPRRRSQERLHLHHDPKELAEHRMLVDLARNDLGRISQPGSVRLVWKERLEKFARLEHLVSRVEGRLLPRVGPWAALAASFPAGTVSGAPKIRATELLRREEGSWRGPYGGAVGLVRGNRQAAWALAIRSAFFHREKMYTAAGAGIVWHSRAAQEFDETLLKLEELENTLLGDQP